VTPDIQLDVNGYGYEVAILDQYLHWLVQQQVKSIGMSGLPVSPREQREQYGDMNGVVTPPPFFKGKIISPAI